MGYWKERYESVLVGNTEIDGAIVAVYAMMSKKDRWIPRMIPDPILGIKGGWVLDPSDVEPTQEEKV